MDVVGIYSPRKLDTACRSAAGVQRPPAADARLFRCGERVPPAGRGRSVAAEQVDSQVGTVRRDPRSQFEGARLAARCWPPGTWAFPRSIRRTPSCTMRPGDLPRWQQSFYGQLERLGWPGTLPRSSPSRTTKPSMPACWESTLARSMSSRTESPAPARISAARRSPIAAGNCAQRVRRRLHRTSCGTKSSRSHARRLCGGFRRQQDRATGDGRQRPFGADVRPPASSSLGWRRALCCWAMSWEPASCRHSILSVFPAVTRGFPT